MTNPNILIVDDDLSDQPFLISVLEQSGYLISSVDSGQGALEWLESHSPDLILLDIIMPGMSGLEVCQKIKSIKKWAHIPIIFLTNSVDMDDKLEGFRVGAVDYISKHFHKEELLARVGAHLNSFFLNQKIRKINSELITAKEKAETYLKMAGNIIFSLSVDGDILLMNRKGLEILGYSKQEIIGKNWFTTCLPGKSIKPASDYFNQLLQKKGGSEATYELEIISRSGEFHHILWVVTVLKKDEVDHARILCSGQDITQHKRREEQLLQASTVFNSTSEGIIITDFSGNITDTNAAFTHITGFNRREIIGQNPNILKSGRHDSGFYRSMWKSLIEQGHWSGEVWNKRKDGSIFPEQLSINSIVNDKQNRTGYVGVFSDITVQKNYEQQLRKLAHFDPLTGLPNRLLLGDRLNQNIAHARRNGHHLAVVYLDLDGFKQVNDTYGHQAGDYLLIEVAKNMKAQIREEDTLCRMGGDEFVAILNALDDDQKGIMLFSRLLAAASKPVSYQDHALNVTASMGITYYPQPKELDPDQIIRQADQAMYQAKLTGKNRYTIFEND